MLAFTPSVVGHAFLPDSGTQTFALVWKCVQTLASQPQTDWCFFSTLPSATFTGRKQHSQLRRGKGGCGLPEICIFSFRKVSPSQHPAHTLIKILLCTAILQAESSHQCCLFPAWQVAVPAQLTGHCLSLQHQRGWPSLGRLSGTWGIGYGLIGLGCDMSLNLRQSHSMSGAVYACPKLFGSSSCPLALLANCWG